MSEEILSNIFLIIAFLVGALASGVVNYFIQRSSQKHQEKQWEKEYEVEKEKRKEAEKKEEREFIRQAYYNSINALTSYIIRTQNQEKMNVQSEYIDKISKNVAIILTKYPDKEIEDNYDYFMLSPNTYIAEDLRYKIIDISKNDTELFSINNQYMQKRKDYSEKEEEILFEFNVDFEFRKQYLEEKGKKLRSRWIKGANLKDINKEIRSILIKVYSSERNLIPERIYLRFPGINHLNNIEIDNSSSWKIKANPDELDVNDVLKLWVEDYEKEYENCLKQLEQEQDKEK